MVNSGVIPGIKGGAYQIKTGMILASIFVGHQGKLPDIVFLLSLGSHKYHCLVLDRSELSIRGAPRSRGTGWSEESRECGTRARNTAGLLEQIVDTRSSEVISN
jgi:hypothetical protein